MSVTYESKIKHTVEVKRLLEEIKHMTFKLSRDDLGLYDQVIKRTWWMPWQ
jgi:hypothetical protein